MSQNILSQSANGRAIDCTDLISGNNNYIQPTSPGQEDDMIVLLHKPTVPAASQPFVSERVYLRLRNLGNRTITVRVDFNGEGEEFDIPRHGMKRFEQTVRGYSSEAVVSIYKRKGDPLLVSGGAEN